LKTGIPSRAASCCKWDRESPDLEIKIGVMG
jgi:hypothetical protein